MLVINISDVAIAILVIGIPTAARIIMVKKMDENLFTLCHIWNKTFLSQVLLDDYVSGVKFGEVDWLAFDFYSPFKRIAACSLLLAYVDHNESKNQSNLIWMKI